MARLRVHQLAKELGIDSKVIMEEAEKHGISVKNHMSSLSDSDEFMLRAFLETVRPAAVPAAEPLLAVEASAGVALATEGSAPLEAWSIPDDDRDEPVSHVAVAPEPPLPRTLKAELPNAAPSIRAEPPHAPPREVRARPAGAPPLAQPVAPSAPSTAAASSPQVAPAASVSASPPTRHVAPTISARPREVSAHRPQVGGAPQKAPTPPPERLEHPAPAARLPDPPPVPPHETRGVRAVPGATTTPPRPSDLTRAPKDAASQRRQAEILGRKELPPPRPRPGSTPPSAGSGLIATRSEGGKRTFVVTGRGRPTQTRGGAGATPVTPGRVGPPGRPGFGPIVGGVGRDRGERELRRPRDPNAPQVPPTLTIQLPTTVKGLSEAMGVKANLLIQKLFVNHKKMVKINDPLDRETVELLGIEFECEITCAEKQDVEAQALDDLQKNFVEDAADRSLRPPIVTFLGHVDHGKTSLLDAIRSTNVAAKEHGGITQHIGATRVKVSDDRSVVFLDTPGHRAFTEMRARGAQVTDVVVLVVAADDGVMPQTKEAIAHARAAKVPIVVALNKIDKPEANPLRVRQELANEGLQDEKWGGKTMIIETAATSGRGIKELIEALSLESEVLELRANPKRPAIGTVLEAEQSRGEGNVARVLVRDGTLRKGDVFVCGTAYGRIRSIKGPEGRFISDAGPSLPVEIAGLNELPVAGDKFYSLDDLETAKEIASKRVHLLREKEIAKQTHVNLEHLFEKLKGQSLKIILKVDVTGSLEVLKNEINSLKHPEVRPEVIHAAVGGISETDVTLADASDAVILGFHVSADMGARRLAEQYGVEIRIYQVIYKLIEELRAALEGQLAPSQKEVITGEVEVRQTWKVTRLGTIAGCHVQSGIIKKSSRVRVSRGGIVILAEGSLESLKRIKDDVREVKEGFDCGLIVANFPNIEVGDIISAFEIETTRRTFDS